MKKIIVFGFENVLFNVSDVENRKKESEDVVMMLKKVNESGEYEVNEKEEMMKLFWSYEKRREKMMGYEVDELRKRLVKLEKNEGKVSRLERASEKEEMLKVSSEKNEKWREEMMGYEVNELREKLIELERKKIEGYRRMSGLKLKTFCGVDEELEKLRSLKRRVVDLKVYVVSDLEMDLVRKSLKDNDISVDGVKGRLERVIEECGRIDDVVVFNGDEKWMKKCEELGVKGVRCKWNGKMEEGADGISNICELWGEIGLRRA